MFTGRIRGIAILHQFIQLLGAVILIWMAFFLVSGFRFEWSLDFWSYIEVTIVLLAASVVEFLSRHRETQSLAGLSSLQLMTVTHRQTLFTLVSIFGTMVMLKDDSLSRAFLSLFFLLYFLWIAWSNRFGYRFLNRYLYRNREKGLSPTLMIGSPPALRKYCNHSKQPMPPGTDIRGYIPLVDGGGTAVASIDFPLMGTIADLRTICEEARIKALLLLGVSDQKDLISSVSHLSSELGLRTSWIDDVEEKYCSGSDPYHTGKFSVVTQIREPLEDPVNRAVKRVFDMVCSALGVMIFLPPLIVLVAVIHRLHSPGPLFYRQKRTGRNGEDFRILKFRTMNVSSNDGFVQARKNDSRIFKGGIFLRRSGIDELPQLINVFTGKMSMVGPRPHPISLDDTLTPDNHTYRLRYFVKPGITGLAQSRGWRGETREPQQIRNRLRFDLFYIRNWSLLFDIRLLFATAVELTFPSRPSH